MSVIPRFVEADPLQRGVTVLYTHRYYLHAQSDRIHALIHSSIHSYQSTHIPIYLYGYTAIHIYAYTPIHLYVYTPIRLSTPISVSHPPSSQHISPTFATFVARRGPALSARVCSGSLASAPAGSGQLMGARLAASQI
jgi:hypothetical protein